jgi:long-chain acyl-CoA synthetase
MLVQDFLIGSARRFPDKIALVIGGARWTYAALDAATDAWARALVQAGLRPGDRVVLHLPNSLAAVLGIFGTLKAGGVFVPIHPTVKADKLKYILTNCGAFAVLTHPDMCPGIAGYQGLMVPLADSVLSSLTPPLPPPASAQPAVLPHETKPSDLACLIYTSGSTGQPKGVMSEHQQVEFASGSIITYLRNTESDVVLCALPLSFDYGLYQLLMTWRFGGTLVLEPNFTYPAAVLEKMVSERVTGFPGVPTMFALLLRADLSAYDLSSLRYVTNTAAALPPAHALRLRELFPKAEVFSMYGLTETKRTLYLPPEQLPHRPGSVGIPIPGTRAWVADENGRPLPAGQVGELVVAGPHVMRGYWGDPQATARRFRTDPDTGQRLCYAGDLFRQDDEGYFYFVARKDDIIKTRGEKVAPKEVEIALYALPGVVEAAVIGVPDALLGQAVKAFVVPDGQTYTAGEVIAHCRRHLEDFMVPRQVEFLPVLPKNNSGKIDKLALAAT